MTHAHIDLTADTEIELARLYRLRTATQRIVSRTRPEQRRERIDARRELLKLQRRIVDLEERLSR